MTDSRIDTLSDLMYLDSRIDTLGDLMYELSESPSLHLRRQVLTLAAEIMPVCSIGYEHLKRSTLLLIDKASLPEE